MDEGHLLIKELDHKILSKRNNSVQYWFLTPNLTTKYLHKSIMATIQCHDKSIWCINIESRLYYFKKIEVTLLYAYRDKFWPLKEAQSKIHPQKRWFQPVTAVTSNHYFNYIAKNVSCYGMWYALFVSYDCNIIIRPLLPATLLAFM